MRAVLFSAFQGSLFVDDVPDPRCTRDGVVVRVEATGLCRSDWHGWMGHDPSIALPHVPGHEFAGTVQAVGAEVRHWRVGDRVTAPFVLGCGTCEPCANGDHQICDDEIQPGFTQWGSFAEFVAVPRADINLVQVPADIGFVAAASLGCRFATSYRAVVHQGRTRRGEWVAVHGCGGVGLSAIMVAVSLGARVIAVDVSPAALEAARAAGAEIVIDGAGTVDVAAEIRRITGGGACVSLDALGSAATCINSIAGLRTRGRHVQIGLMVGEFARPGVPMEMVIARELEIRGSHGMAAHEYPAMMAAVAGGSLRPDQLVGRVIDLHEAPAALQAMGRPPEFAGMTVIRPIA